jgi:DoxX-like family
VGRIADHLDLGDQLMLDRHAQHEQQPPARVGAVRLEPGRQRVGSVHRSPFPCGIRHMGMSTTHLIVIILTASANILAGAIDFVRPQWILANMTRAGVPHSWLFMLGALKVAGGLGLVLGFAIPALGIAAAAGLILFFAGAIVTSLRARWYAHLPYPAAFLLLAIAALAVQATA